MLDLYRPMIFCIFCLLFSLSTLACNTELDTGTCTSDLDCDGEKICENNSCILPSDIATDGDSSETDAEALADGDEELDTIEDDSLEEDQTDTAEDLCQNNPCITMENSTCEALTGNCICNTGFCQIAGLCVADGTANNEQKCLICDSNRQKTGWSLGLISHECREASGPCDVAEFCDGQNPECPEDLKLTSECRPSAGQCDAVDFCDGIHNQCPDDAKLTVECRSANGVCDAVDFCNGVDNDCPADIKLTSKCRDSVGICDAIEFCDGINNNCPADNKLTSECRPATGVCDKAEFCNGTGNTCPTDTKLTTECRSSAGVCDKADFCDGLQNICPIDAKLTSQCRDAAGVCDKVEYCDGQNNSCPTDTKLTIECRPSSGTCDAADFCDGTNNDCPEDLAASNGEMCNDENLCTVGDTCQNGTCTGSPKCSDNKSCTTDNCNAANGSCTYDIVDEHCLINNTCYDTGQANPLNNCDECNPDVSNTNWYPKVTDSPCTDDGNPCTYDVCDGMGLCLHPSNTSSCDDGNNCTDNDVCENNFCSGTSYSCNGNGTCNAFDNSCTCHRGFSGTYCDSCDSGYIDYPNCHTPGFANISAGTFWMGSPDGSCPYSYPGSCINENGRMYNEGLHRITLTYDFEMQIHEVTQGEFSEFARNPSYFGSNGAGANCGANCPVERVSWLESLLYANWLSEESRLEPCYVLTDCVGTIGGGCDYDIANCSEDTYSCNFALNGVSKPQNCEGYRLPTEAEWEYAIRSGNEYTAFYQTDESNGTYTGYGSDYNLDVIAWYKSTATVTTHPVGQKPANAWGLYDMSGNVDEFVWDYYDFYYENGPSTDPTGATFDEHHVRRGGSFMDIADCCRSAYRHVTSEGYRSVYSGFRLCRTLH